MPAGIAIGNGWVDPFFQFETNPQFAYENGIINEGQQVVAKFLFEICQYSLLLRVPLLGTLMCQVAGISIAAPLQPEFNVYDIRKPCERIGLCYPDDHLD